MQKTNNRPVAGTTRRGVVPAEREPDLLETLVDSIEEACEASEYGRVTVVIVFGTSLDVPNDTAPQKLPTVTVSDDRTRMDVHLAASKLQTDDDLFETAMLVDGAINSISALHRANLRDVFVHYTNDTTSIT